uniref:Uncharacterized protein n=1 Tax=Micrurus lemniscatus lemniscatus TaxID=129467 RepID=A0A2D4H5M5_MICLE
MQVPACNLINLAFALLDEIVHIDIVILQLPIILYFLISFYCSDSSHRIVMQFPVSSTLNKCLALAPPLTLSHFRREFCRVIVRMKLPKGEETCESVLSRQRMKASVNLELYYFMG